MKFKILLLSLLVLATVTVVHAEMSHEGIFAYQEVDTVKFHDIKLTIPESYKEKESNKTFKSFVNNDKDEFNISFIKNGKIDKVKKNKTVNSGTTKLGSLKGYLVDNNDTYKFSYRVDDDLVVIEASDLSIIMGVLGLD